MGKVWRQIKKIKNVSAWICKDLLGTGSKPEEFSHLTFKLDFIDL